MAEDYYQTLGVNRTATPAEIQKAYRDLARKYHPDLNPDDKSAREKFQKVQAAFDVLNDTDKRAKYDQFGSAYESVGAGPGGASYRWGKGQGQPEFTEFDLGDLFGGGAGQAGGFGDIFRNFSGRREGGRPTARRGADLTTELEIPFNTAVAGGEAQVTVQRATGKRENITVQIPAGISDGKRIRLRGQGEPGAGEAQAGDILIEIRVAPHPFFTRRGKRLDVQVPVTLAEAALGAKVDVPTPRGTITLSVPPGTTGGTKMRIKGHGVAPPNDTPGDLFAEIQIAIPHEFDDEDREAIRQLDRKHPMNPRRELRW